MSKPRPLIVIPTFLTNEAGLTTTIDAVKSVRKTAGDSVDVMLIDDGSPEKNLVAQLTDEMSQLKSEVHAKEQNSGFSKTVNIGLRKARDEGRDAILMNADIEITTPGWYRYFKTTQDQNWKPAAVVGALLLYPSGLIQHAGIYFSLLTRTFDHLYKYGPPNLPEALKKSVCPVTGALQYIRHSTLETIGLYDEGFYMGWEDVDYCLRVFAHDEQCIYNPNVRAYHFEYMFRGEKSPKIAEWQEKSWMYLCEKWKDHSFAQLVPTIW